MESKHRLNFLYVKVYKRRLKLHKSTHGNQLFCVSKFPWLQSGLTKSKPFLREWIEKTVLLSIVKNWTFSWKNVKAIATWRSILSNSLNRFESQFYSLTLNRFAFSANCVIKFLIRMIRSNFATTFSKLLKTGTENSRVR